MSEKCARCGGKMTGMFGSLVPDEHGYGMLEAIGVMDKNICYSCAGKALEQARGSLRDLLREKQKALFPLLPQIRVFTAPSPDLWQAEIKGLVSGYSVIGTGPISALASAWTDFFGKESVAYLDKIRIGESNAMLAARMQAAELGASAISSCTISVTEATSGNGMLMISCVGTAISRNSDDELSTTLHALHTDIAALQEQLKKLE